MSLSLTQVQLTEDVKTIYMLHWGEYEDTVVLGPYLGVASIDFNSLSIDYRNDRYAAKEAAMEDECVLSQDDFVDWLLANNILQTVKSTAISINLSSACDDAYVPRHWPDCPECRHGRGRQEYGDYRKSLNRVVTLFQCTECRHTWGHREIASNSSMPMLDDDGRDTPAGCVPFSISKACRLPFSVVAAVCKKHGWDHNGMAQTNAAIATRELGFNLIRQTWLDTYPTSPTIKRVVADLPSDRSYIIGVKDHWLAFVNGAIVDNDTQTGLARRVVELYEVRQVQTIAA